LYPRKSCESSYQRFPDLFDKNELMTSHFAKVYLEQKKYKKAIQAYKIFKFEISRKK